MWPCAAWKASLIRAFQRHVGQRYERFGRERQILRGRIAFPIEQFAIVDVGPVWVGSSTCSAIFQEVMEVSEREPPY
jgi:hypothetical protein